MINSKILLLVIGYLACVFILYGCRCLGEPPSLSSTGLKFSLIDKNTGINLFRSGASQIPEYNKDTIKLFNQDFQQIELEKIQESFLYSFQIRYIYEYGEDESAFNAEKCKRYYLYLNQNDTDTLDLCFTAENLKCNGQWFKEFKVLYNSKLIYQKQKSTVFDIDIKK
jgi:hypothetical protein